MPLPAVLTIQSGINQLRYAKLKGIMAAKKKEIKKVASPGRVPALKAIVSLYVPEKRKQTQVIGGSSAEAAKELGVELIWDGPTGLDAARQNEVIDNWITRKVDVIAVAV